MEQLVIDVEELTTAQVAELLGIVRDMRSATRPAPTGEDDYDPDREAYDQELHDIAWGHTGRQGELHEEEAFAVFNAVIDHGRTVGRDWAPLLIALVQANGDKITRDHARSLVTSNPHDAVHALRGLKQAFDRATKNTRSWQFLDTYTPHYADPYSGVTHISLGEPFCHAVQQVLHVD